ncbi:flagellar assembly protein FliH [Sideroxydans lithotrophicus]|uniref:Flagellar assembly protein FliH n=1 Tax=Sideroxydans lithotrophicus (strain ES-1) TaxID=580332 RepID=D5CN00_SIDLE|nr:flagellar assembly protein FliH [Sideroxydans lithotrophicus]ADE10836.1 Flagellar assembly protein FliH/Type III secretion system HrpE [Sideroxydans lithotrophicus ES-1]
MSDAAVAPEKLTAWQRWEAPAFEAGGKRAGDVALPTASQIEEIQRQAREEGFQSGYAEGLQSAAQEQQLLAQVITSLGQQVDEQVSRELLGLSLDIARQMLHQALKVNPELLLGVVSEAIGTLPHFSQGAHLVLHPDDAVVVRKHMGEQLTHSGWKIFEDARIERGGARIETANSQIDASLESRWKRVVAALGQDTSWLVQE